MKANHNQRKLFDVIIDRIATWENTHVLEAPLQLHNLQEILWEMEDRGEITKEQRDAFYTITRNLYKDVLTIS